MKKNRLLSAALVLCTISKIFFIMLLTAITLVLLHWHISPETYKDVVVTVDRGGEVKYVFADNANFVSTDSNVPKETNNNHVAGTLSQINQLTLYFLYLQTIGHFILLILITNQVISIIKSVKALETFRSSNSKAFRKIGFLCLAIALLTCISWFETATGEFTRFSIEPVALAFALGAFILAEIFKEGNKLYEAEQLTI